MHSKNVKYILAAVVLTAGMALTGCGADGTASAGSETETVSGKTADPVAASDQDKEKDDPASASGREDGSDQDSNGDAGEIRESGQADETGNGGADASKNDTSKDDASNDNASEGETAQEEAVDPVTMYTLESITLRGEPSGSSEDLGVVAIGSKIEAYEISGDYIRVAYDGKEGYVLKDYVTEDRAAADKAVEESVKAARQASEASEKKSSDDQKSSGKKKSDKKSKDEECLDNGLLN